MTYISIVIIIFIFCVALIIGTAFLLIKTRSREKRKEPPSPENGRQETEQKPSGPQEGQEWQIWTELLKDYENARVYNGLYNGLRRLAEGQAKRPERVIREWCQRTRYRWEGSEADRFCRSALMPAAEEKNQEAMADAARRILNAAGHAGITKETQQRIVLDGTNADAYEEWDGGELYEGDAVEVIAPAWYHGGKVLEQGQCRIAS